jgi:hypothetical protein
MGTSKTEKTTMDPLMQQFFGETYIPAIESFLERPYEAFTGERVAGLTPTTERLLGEAQMLQTPEEFAAAKGVVSGVATMTPEELSQRRGQYAQEYTDLILDPTRSRLMREQAIKRSQEAGEMTRALGGAGFGASRRGVMEGEREAARDVAIAELEADIARQGLDYGTQRLLSDVGVTTGAAGQLAQLGLSELGAETDILGRKMAVAAISVNTVKHVDRICRSVAARLRHNYTANWWARACVGCNRKLGHGIWRNRRRRRRHL